MHILEEHFGAIFCITLLGIFVLWDIADKKLPLEGTEQHECSLKKIDKPLLFWIKILVALQILTLFFSILNYFKY